MRVFRAVRQWLDARFGWDDLVAPLRKKTVPHHTRSYWYYLGGMTLFLFLVQVVTGILLLLYYRPSSDQAFESVQYIVTQVRFGWLVRSIHSWGANLMIFMAFSHMFSVVFLRAYRRPRELTWLSGMLLLFIVLGFGFSGYLLPWNTRAFFATQVGTDIPGQIPFVGKWIETFLRGGENVTGATLGRFFGFHVAVLPGIVTLLLALHLLLIQRFGISVPPDVERQWATQPSLRREIHFFPNFLLRELMAWYVALGVLGALAAFVPWELGTKADAFAPAPAGIRPEWFFMFMFQTLKMIPAKVLSVSGELLGILGFGVAASIWTLLPFFDRDGRGRVQRWITGAGVFAVAYILVMTAYGYMAK